MALFFTSCLPAGARLGATAVAGALLLAVAFTPVRAAEPAVWCVDDTKKIVNRTLPDSCDGRVVGESEADRIRQERAARIQRALKGPKPAVEGKRLAGLGTGFVVGPNGEILTNHHVAGKCDALSVTPPSGAEMIAELLSADEALDLALLKASGPAGEVARFRDSFLYPGSDVAVVGYPLLGRVAIRPIFVEGIVDTSGASPLANRYLIVMDVRHGNSGGPVLDRGGNVVGVVVAKVNTPAVYASTGRVIRDIGVAIRPQTARTFLGENGVSPVVVPAGAELSNDELFAKASRLVVQIRCWK